jgi:hypothetical protein
MPSSDSQAFLCKLIRSDDTPVGSKTGVAAQASRFLHFAGSSTANHTHLRPRTVSSNSTCASLGAPCSHWHSFAFEDSSKFFDSSQRPADTFSPDLRQDCSLSRHRAAAAFAEFVNALPIAEFRSHWRTNPADHPNVRLNPPLKIKVRRRSRCR